MGFIVGFLIPLAVFAVIMLVGYLKRKKKVTPAAPKQWRNEFQGLDLNEWVYLGYQVLKLDNTEYVVHLFCKHDDHSVRTYRIQGTEYGKKMLEEYHTYMHKYTQPWSMGTGELYYYNHSPSTFLKEYMVDNFGHVWSPEEKWWVPSEKAKHSAAAKKQKAEARKQQPAVTSVEENVVQVNFGKKDES